MRHRTPAARPPGTRRSRHLRVLLPTVATAALATLGATARAQTTLTWNGHGWDGGWTSFDFPSNTPGQTYSLRIDGGNPASSTATISSPDPIGGAPATRATVDAVSIDAGDTLSVVGGSTLTILDHLTLDGTLSFGFEGGTVILGDGNLAGTGKVVGGGRVTSAGGPFTIGPGILLRGAAVNSYSSGWLTVGNPAAPLINQGRVIADGTNAGAGAAAVTLSGNAFTNTGSVEATNGGVVAFDVPFQRVSDLGPIAATSGGRFRIAGTLDNTGRTFALDASTPDWELAGTVRGGRISTADGRSVFVTGSSVLDDVTIDGNLRMMGAPTLRLTHETLGGSGTIELAGFSDVRSDADRLVVGPGFTVTGSTGAFYFDYGLGDKTRPTVNQGRIVVEPGKTLQVNGSTFSNEGTIDVRAGGTLSINSTFRLADLGTYTHDGTIRITGTLDNAGQTFSTATPGAWELAGTIRGGSIETPDGTPLVVPMLTTARLDNTQLNGVLRLDGFGDFQGATDFKLIIPAGQTLSGSGTVLLTGEFSQDIVGEGGLSIGDHMTVRGNVGRIGTTDTPLVNRGTVISEVPRGSIELAGSTIHNGGPLFASNGGTLVFNGGAYTLADLGNVSAKDGIVRFRGVLDATAETLDVNAETGRRQLWGTLRGASIRSDADHPLEVLAGSTLDHVTFAGGAVATFDGGTLTVNGPLAGSGELRLSSVSSLRFNDPAASIGRGMTVRDSSPFSQVAIGDLTRPLVNDGTIRADSSRVTVAGSSLTIRGRLYVGEFGHLIPQGPLSFDSGGTLFAIVGPQFNNESAIVASGDLNLSTPDDSLELRLGPSFTQWNQPWLLATYTGRLAGVFDHVTPGFTVDYSTPGAIYVTPVPEPAGLAPLATMLGFSLRRRRRS